jgi:hypothetical protein
MGSHRPASFIGALAMLAMAACSTPVAELNDAGGGSTGGVGGAIGGGTGGSTNTGGTVGSGSSGGGTTTGTGSTGGTGSTTGSTTTGGNSGTTGGTTGSPDGGVLGTACLIKNGSDPCLIYGLVCRQVMTPGEYGFVCQFPGEFEACFPSVGCSSADLHCLTIYSPMCVHTCAASSDCPQLFTSCQTWSNNQVCFYDACDGGAFGSCDQSGTGDGTCLPENFLGGLCLGGGTATAGSPCHDHRTPTSQASDFCAHGMTCLPLGQPAGGGNCVPICGTTTAGPACPSPTFCVQSGQGPWGYCL